MNRIALLLELIGFCMASVSVAALQIDKIKNWADGVKSFLQRKFEEFSDPELQQIIKSRSLAKELSRVGDCVILNPFRALKDVFRILVVPLNISLPCENRKKVVKLSFEILERRIQRFGLGYKLFIFVITVALLRSLFWSMYLSLKILSRNQAVTRIMIVTGTTALLAGLILELIANW